MRNLLSATLFVATALASPAAAECEHPDQAIGLERVVEIDATGGPLFGALTKQEREPSFLRPKEVVLTFDDGPSPWVTPKILDTLEKHCTRATFFAVGKMAVAYPALARDIIARGHTVGGHTLSHPRRLPNMAAKKAHDEIERGFAALEAATGGGIAPFFRFTGLNDSAALLTYLQRQRVASFTVDVVSDDSFIPDPKKLARVTLARTRARGGGILLFHDIKSSTAKALPAILAGLKKDGFKIVHMRHTVPYAPQPELVEDYRARVAEKLAGSKIIPRLMPYYGAISELREDEKEAASEAYPLTRIAPPPRARKERKRKTKQRADNRKAKPSAKSKPKQDVPVKPEIYEVDEDEVLPWKQGSLGFHFGMATASNGQTQTEKTRPAT
ncbi:MAG: polysaccharide deacetylase family protein [Filomicrobium sp.]